MPDQQEANDTMHRTSGSAALIAGWIEANV